MRGMVLETGEERKGGRGGGRRRERGRRRRRGRGRRRRRICTYAHISILFSVSLTVSVLLGADHHLLPSLPLP